MADFVYNRAKNNITISDLRVVLYKSGYTANKDHDTLDDLGTYECDFTNYARKALANEAFSVNDTSDTGKLDSDDPAAWSTAGGTTDNTIGGMVVYEYVSATDDTLNLPVSHHDTGFPISTNGGSVTVQFAATGIVVTS